MSLSMSSKRPTHTRQPSLIPASTDAFLRLIATSAHVPYTSLPGITLAQPIVLLQSPPPAPPAAPVSRYTLSYRGVWSPEDPRRSREETEMNKYRTFAVYDAFLGKTFTVYVWAGASGNGSDDDLDLLMSPAGSPLKSSSNGNGRAGGLKRSGSYSSSSTLSSSSSGRDVSGSSSTKRMVGASERFTIDNERFRDMLVDTLAGIMSKGQPTAWINNF